MSLHLFPGRAILPDEIQKVCAVKSLMTSTITSNIDIKKPRVGVVGEILVKFLPAANNYLVDLTGKRRC